MRVSAEEELEQCARETPKIEDTHKYEQKSVRPTEPAASVPGKQGATSELVFILHNVAHNPHRIRFLPKWTLLPC